MKATGTPDPFAEFIRPQSHRRLLSTAVVVSLVLLLAAVLVLVLSATAQAASFPDVPASHSYVTAIENLADRDVISGYTDGTFGPQDPVRRQQFAKMIVLSLGLDPLPADQCPFADVEATWPYPRGYVATAAQNHITVGKTATTFSPYDYITRAQVVTMVVRSLYNLRPGTLDEPPTGYVGTLGDFSPDHAANMREAEYNGLLTGLEGFGSSWSPWQNATRGEVAQMLWNMLQLTESFTLVSTGWNHSLALGSLWAWGLNSFGQLGDSTTTERHLPTRIGTDTGWKAVAAGRYHSLALKTDGSLWAWGGNGYGQLGDGTTSDRWMPTRIGMGTDWRAVTAGGWHSLAIKEDGSLWAWGLNSLGRLGDGTITDRHLPTRIGMGTDWQTVAAGRYDTLALKTDGSFWAWGHNSHGQLGDGTTTDRHLPTRIGMGTDWEAIAAGRYHTIARKTDGSLWAWGYNYEGQLGDGMTTDRHVPTRIGTDTDWRAVAAGEWHSLGMKEDSSLWAWGHNEYGRLGDGTTTDRWVPTRVH